MYKDILRERLVILKLAVKHEPALAKSQSGVNAHIPSFPIIRFYIIVLSVPEGYRE